MTYLFSLNDKAGILATRQSRLNRSSAAGEQAGRLRRRGGWAPRLMLGLLAFGFAISVAPIVHPDVARAQDEPAAEPAPKPVPPKPVKNTKPVAAKPKPPGEAQKKEEASKEAAAAANPDTKFFLDLAKNAGAATCAGTYATLGGALINGAHFTVQTQTAKPDADKHAIEGVVGLTYNNPNDYSGPATGYLFAVPREKGCEGAMVRVVPFPQTCEVVATLMPKNGTPQPPLGGLTVYGIPSGQVILLPAGNSCTAITVLHTMQ